MVGCFHRCFGIVSSADSASMRISKLSPSKVGENYFHKSFCLNTCGDGFRSVACILSTIVSYVLLKALYDVLRIYMIERAT